MKKNHVYANLRRPETVRLYKKQDDGRISECICNVGPQAEGLKAQGWYEEVLEVVPAPSQEEVVAQVARIMREAKKFLGKVPKEDLEWACDMVGVPVPEGAHKQDLLDLLVKTVEG